MKKKILFVVILAMVVCLFPKIEKCKCGGTTYTSLTYRIEKANIDFNGTYRYSVDIFGIDVYNSISTANGK